MTLWLVISFSASTQSPEKIITSKYKLFFSKIKTPSLAVISLNAEPNDFALDVIISSGKIFAVDDPNLTEMLGEGLKGENRLTLVRLDRALTDCRPVSLISLQTVRQIEAEMNIPIEKRRFRAI